ncbi:MAG TPA: hypothetical protein VEQ60_10190 [Longimicrobium sp.]|nr:hypothetical protein [Longimicrobium sp.]
MNPLALRALWQTGRLYPEQVPALAVDLLAGGADSPALRELAGMDRPTRAEVEPAIDRALLALGAPRLDEDAAGRIAAREIAADTIAGRMAPYDAAISLSALWLNHELPLELAVFVGLVGEWVDHPAVRAEVEATILEECEQVLAEVHVEP